MREGEAHFTPGPDVEEEAILAAGPDVEEEASCRQEAILPPEESGTNVQ